MNETEEFQDAIMNFDYKTESEQAYRSKKTPTIQSGKNRKAFSKSGRKVYSSTHQNT